jgi:hypothetical protein
LIIASKPIIEHGLKNLVVNFEHHPKVESKFIYTCFCESSHLSQQDSFPVNLVHKSAATSEYLHAEITIYNFQFNFLGDLGTKILMKNLLELQN